MHNVANNKITTNNKTHIANDIANTNSNTNTGIHNNTMHRHIRHFITWLTLLVQITLPITSCIAIMIIIIILIILRWSRVRIGMSIRDVRHDASAIARTIATHSYGFECDRDYYSGYEYEREQDCDHTCELA